MYIDYFGFKQSPFSITPDPGFLFLSHDHKEAFAHLLYGVGDTGGFVQLTGEVGTGKTTLCRYLMENTPEEVDVALILNPRQSALELVASICDELGIGYPSENGSIKVLIDRLNAHLMERHGQGRRTVLVIDEAQNLSVEVLEQIRLLTNLETNRHKLLQILLIGQPELQSIMDRPELRQLDQRITARYHLRPLSLSETTAYITHRLAVAGCEKKLFTTRALKEIFRRSQGVPRLINILCDRALLGAYAKRAAQVDPRLVKAADREIKGRPAVSGRVPRWAWTLPLLALLIVGAGWAYTQWPFERTPTLSAPVEEAPQIGDKASVSSLPTEKPQPPQESAPAVPPEAEDQAASTEVPAPAAPAGVESSQAPAPPTIVDNAAAATTVPLRADLLALAVPRENRPPTPPRNLMGMLNDGRLPTDARTAYTELFRYWLLDFDDLPGNTACLRAMSVGLRCLQETASFKQLVSYNRPAVLTLFDAQGRVHYVTVSAVDEDRLTVNIGGKAKTVDQAELLPVWNGQLVLLWRPPLLENPILQVGSRGNDVLWLREQLALIEGGATASDEALQKDVFDENLRRQVIRFQRRSGVMMDGIVGEKTLLHLNAAAADDRTPVLRLLPQEENR